MSPLENPFKIITRIANSTSNQCAPFPPGFQKWYKCDPSARHTRRNYTVTVTQLLINGVRVTRTLLHANFQNQLSPPITISTEQVQQIQFPDMRFDLSTLASPTPDITDVSSSSSEDDLSSA